MKLPRMLLITALVLALAGCSRWREEERQAIANERRMVTAVLAETEAQGLITRHTLGDCHFVPGTAELNELGQRDLGVLARHWSAHGGRGVLNVRAEEGAPSLNEARLAAATRYLETQGIRGPALTIERGWPGGEGMGAERAAKLLRMADPTSCPNPAGAQTQPEVFKVPSLEASK